jgi:predicted anti-sigma-YlaC factor YlaD
MECSEAERLLGAFVDGELERIQHLDVETHVADCSTCNKATDAAIKLRQSIHMYKPVYKTPPELKATIRAVLRKESESEREWLIKRRRPLLYAAAVLVVCLLCVSAWMAASPPQRSRADRPGDLGSFTFASLRSPSRRHIPGSTHRQTLVHWKARLFSPNSGSSRHRL